MKPRGFPRQNILFSSTFFFVPRYAKSGRAKKPPTSWVKKEFKMAMIKENKEGKQSIIPVRIKNGRSIPHEIGEKAYADLTTAKRWANNFPKLCQVLGI